MQRDGRAVGSYYHTHCTKSMSRLQIIHFVICAVGVFFNSFAFSFSVIGESVKAVFGLTQSQVELASSLYFVGTCLNLIPGYVYDKHGALYTAKRGILLSAVAWSSVVIVCHLTDTFRGRYVILSVLFLLAGHGKSFVLLPIMVSGLNTFSKPHRGKALALLATVYTVGPLVPVAIFKMYFSSGITIEDKQANLAMFVLFLGFTLFFVGVMFCNSPALHNKTFAAKLAADNAEDLKVVRYSYRQLLCHVDVILFTLSFAFILGTAITFETNIPFFAESLGLSSHSALLIVLHRICQGSFRLMMGFVIDWVKSVTTRLVVFLSFAILSVGGLFLWTTHLSTFQFFILASLCAGSARGVYGIFILICCEIYDSANHGKIFALADTFLGLTIWTQQQTFGFFYESAMGNIKGTICHGDTCLARTGQFLTTISLVGAVLSFLSVFRSAKIFQCNNFFPGYKLLYKPMNLM